nr:amino acid racemase [Thaumasiovibrio subtropicus]
MSAERKLGILGGMGPLATVAFMQKIIELTDAVQDQGHLPMIVSNVPQIPDRTSAILNQGVDPFPMLKKHLNELESAHASLFVMPCNTAHYWHEKLSAQSKLASISIIDSVVNNIAERGLTKVGILATSATLSTRLYQSRLADEQVACVVPDGQAQEQVMAGIYAVKSGAYDKGSALLMDAFDRLRQQGAQAVILGCTEIPIALSALAKTHPEWCIDSIEVLAKACVNWYFGELNPQFEHAA